MAVTTDFLEQKIQLHSHHGNVDGKEKMTSRNYGDVKAASTDADSYDVAEIITELHQPVMEEVVKQEMNLELLLIAGSPAQRPQRLSDQTSALNCLLVAGSDLELLIIIAF